MATDSSAEQTPALRPCVQPLTCFVKSEAKQEVDQPKVVFLTEL